MIQNTNSIPLKFGTVVTLQDPMSSEDKLITAVVTPDKVDDGSVVVRPSCHSPIACRLIVDRCHLTPAPGIDMQVQDLEDPMPGFDYYSGGIRGDRLSGAGTLKCIATFDIAGRPYNVVEGVFAASKMQPVGRLEITCDKKNHGHWSKQPVNDGKIILHLEQGKVNFISYTSPSFTVPIPLDPRELEGLPDFLKDGLNIRT